MSAEVMPEFPRFPADDDDHPPDHATAAVTEETCCMTYHSVHPINRHVHEIRDPKWDKITGNNVPGRA